MDAQSVCWLIAVVLCAIAAVMAGTRRAWVETLGWAGVALLTLGLLVPAL